MATRLYPARSTTPGSAAISPAFDAGWEVTSSAVRRLLMRAATGEAFANTQSAGLGAAGNGTNPNDSLVRQFISEKPLAAQTISGTVRGQFLMREDNAALNARPQIRAYVISSDAATVRGTLLDYDTGANDATEFATTYTNRSMPRSGTVAITSVVAQAGDYLVVEMGARIHSTDTTDTYQWRTGGTGASDLPVDNTTTTDGYSWIEFSGNIGWLYTQAITGGVTPAGVLIDTSKKFLTGAVSTLTGALIRTAKKFVTGGATPAGALVDTTKKLLTGAVSSIAGALVDTGKKFLSGAITSIAGTTIQQVRQQLRGFFSVHDPDVPGSVTRLAGTERNRPTKVATGSEQPAGGNILQATLHAAGSLTPTGAVVRRSVKILAGTATTAGAVIRSVLAHVAGGVAPSGSTVQDAQLHVAGGSTPTGAILRTAAMAVTSSIIPRGNLATLANRVLTGSLAPSGTLAKLVARALTGSVATAGALLRTVTRTVVGSIAPAGSVAAGAVDHLDSGVQTVIRFAQAVGAGIRAAIGRGDAQAEEVGTASRIRTAGGPATRISGATQAGPENVEER